MPSRVAAKVKENGAHHLLFAVSSGLAACFASVFSKLAASPESEEASGVVWVGDLGRRLCNAASLGTENNCTTKTAVVLRAVCVFLVVSSNVAMWTLFTKGLNKAPSSALVTVINNAANICFTAVLGYILFGDMAIMNKQWWIGIICIIAGSFLITRGQVGKATKEEKRE